MQKKMQTHTTYLLTYSPEYLLTYLISYWLTHTCNKLHNYFHTRFKFNISAYLYFTTFYNNITIYHIYNITKMLLTDCVYKDCNIQKNYRFSLILVEKIK